MWIRASGFVFLVLIVTQHSNAEDNEFFICCDSGQPTAGTNWYVLGHDGFAGIESVCKDNITTSVISYSGTVKVNYQPKSQFGILGVSFCKDKTLEDCYVVEIFGLVSGRMGYFWRRQSRNETGEELWVPGKKTKLKSNVIKSDNVVRQGTWDREGRTQYQFYIETGYDDHVRIRYNGGTAKQQNEMTLKVPYQDYTVITVASYYNDSSVTVEGATGCTIYQRLQFEPGQDVNLSWERPKGAIGVSLCTDSGQYECYVLEVVGVHNDTLDYYWRKYSLFEESGEDGWVPGLETNLKGIVLSQGENKWKFMDDSAWTEAPGGLTLFLKKTFDDKIQVHMSVYQRDSYAWANPPKLVFDIPSNFQFTTVANRAIESGREINRADIATYGPCYNGDRLEFITQTCKHQIPARDPAWPKDENFFVFSPKPGVAEASLVTDVLQSKGTRKNLCVSLIGIASPKGGSIIVTAMDASGKSNQSVQVGQLSYNKIFPPEWQRVRMSVELPPSLQNVPLKIKLTSKRSTPDSFVLLSEAKLCSNDGCGLPTADGRPFIAFGEKTFPSKYPWHVAIFLQTNQTHFDYICGGSLVRSDAAISAAHCFFDENGKLRDKGKFKLAVGKVYNSLLDYEPNQQFSHALDIHIPPRYKGRLNNFVHDIAIIRVNFTTSPLVLPACLDWFGTNVPSLKPGTVGQVAGWGLHEGNQNNKELYFGKLPYIPYEQCVKAVPETFLEYVTTDKFCAGNINGTTVKKGDSGGGLVFETGGLWYLRGVVSTGVPNQLTYSTFTEISQFLPWIRDVLNIRH